MGGPPIYHFPVRTCSCCPVRSKFDEYGFERPDNFDYVEYEKFMSVYLTVLTKRSMRWLRLMASNPRLKRNNRLRLFVRKGVPMTLRAQVRRLCVSFSLLLFLINYSLTFDPGMDIRWRRTEVKRRIRIGPIQTTAEQTDRRRY